MADVQIAVIDDTENQVNVAVPGIQGPIGTTGSVTIAQAGTAATPGIRFESDTNTGIYSPGADQLAVSTGGTGRLFVDASGRVGIGTSSPSSLLTVAGKTTLTGTEDNQLEWSLSGQVWRVNTSAAGSWYVFDSTNSKFPINIAKNSTIAVAIADSHLAVSAGGTERARIDSSGRVGIGTSSPSGPLHVANATAGAQNLIVFQNTANGTDLRVASPAAGGQFFVTATAGDSVLRAETNNLAICTADATKNILFGTSAAQRMCILGTGNVGIGTSSPGGRLSIRSDRATETYAATIGTNNGVTFENDFVFGFNGTVQSIGNFQNFPLALIVNNTERLRIDSSGRLLVGTSSARANFFNSSFTNKVQIEGTSFQNSGLSVICNNSSILEAAAINFNKSAADSIGSNTLTGNNHKLGLLTFQGNDGTQFIDAARIEAFVDGDSSVDDMPGRLVFLTTADGASNPTERLRITSAGALQVADAGNITVGTTTGTKIGTATTQKLGFYNATPVVQPAAVADATDAASVITQLNALLTRMRNLGLIAT